MSINNIQGYKYMDKQIMWAGLLALMLVNTAHAAKKEEGGTRPGQPLYKHVHKPSNIRMPWMVPAGTVTARPDGKTVDAAKNNEKTSNKQKQP